MELDTALARGIDREIRRRRDEARQDDPRSTFWTERDVARRMTDAGYPMHHPAVVLTRQGRRKVPAHEWLIFALVLSVPPVRLLDPSPGKTVDLAGESVTVDDLANWLHGIQPLDSVESKPLYYASAGRFRRPDASHFAATIRGLADHFDTAESAERRQELTEDIARAAVDQMRNARQVRKHVARRAQKGKG
jgi:hypothetical protein